jgi:hypothetical protein
MKCLDLERIHFIEGDTDSSYWAVAGDPKLGLHQRFDAIVKDQEFYKRKVFKWFPKTCVAQVKREKGDAYWQNLDYESKLKVFTEEKKLLGLAIEREGIKMIALSPKCYTFTTTDEKKIMKNKGVSSKESDTNAIANVITKDGTIRKLNSDDYLTPIQEKRVVESVGMS